MGIERTFVIVQNVMLMKTGIKIFAPASISNVAVGFDVLGIAIEQPGDEVVAKLVEEPGIHIHGIINGNNKIPKDPRKNTAAVAATAVLRHLGKQDEVGILLEIRKQIPLGSGIGGSAASAVAGAVAVNELFRKPLETRQLLPFAMEGERVSSPTAPADNVAASLLGGICMVRDVATNDIVRLPAMPGLYIVVLRPHIEILTGNSRTQLTSDVPLNNAVQQTANMAGFVASLYTMDLDLMRRSLRDVLIESQRKATIPNFDAIQAAALEADALCCSISGAGPSLFALCANSLIAEQVGTAMQAASKQRCDVFTSAINTRGAYKM